MINKKNIEEEFEKVKALGNITDIFGQIASLRMMKIRRSVLLNRDFLASINDIFQEVLASYAQKIELEDRRRKIKRGNKVTFLAHNGKAVAVFLSANSGFYGDLIKEAFGYVMQDLKDSELEVTIVGKMGLALFKEAMPSVPFTYFDMPDYGVDSDKLSALINHLVQYEKIKLYYGKYFSVVSQKPSIFNISAGQSVEEKAKERPISYIFEPNAEKILMFFETEIFASLFDQAIRESQLAKFASRIMAMDKANQNISQEIRAMKLTKLKLSHQDSNKKQLNLMTTLFTG